MYGIKGTFEKELDTLKSKALVYIKQALSKPGNPIYHFKNIKIHEYSELYGDNTFVVQSITNTQIPHVIVTNPKFRPIVPATHINEYPVDIIVEMADQIERKLEQEIVRTFDDDDLPF